MPSNLIKIDDFKIYKGINSDNDDPIISSLIGSVSEFIKNYTSRELIEYSLKDKTEYFDAVNYPEYYPSEFPIQSVTSLEVSTDGGVTYTALVEDTDFFVDLEDERIISNTTVTGFVSSTITHKSGKLVYKGGYVATPLDLRLAAMDLVEFHRKNEHAPNMSMAGASVENPVVFVKGNALPPHIRRVLDNYRVL